MVDLFPDTLTGLDAQIAEVKRELEQRERVYPRLISGGTLTQVRADRQMAAMRAVLATLEGLRR
jgi:hypothetical protein